MSRWPRRGRLGLRARSSAAFGLVGLVLSLVLAGITYERSRVYLLRQRESGALSQAALNARSLSRALLSSNTDPARVLATVINVSGSVPLLFRNERWYVTSANVVQDDLPEALRQRAMAGTATRQRFILRGQPQLAVAIPLTVNTNTPTVYIETFPLDELQRTLNTLGATLGAAAVAATLVAAVLGLAASRRVLRPLGAITDTAKRVAAGDLRARLSGADDPDLRELVSSFNQMTESVQSTIERERRFASDIGHELRSPLTSMRGAMSIVKGRAADLPERVQVGINLLDDEVSRFERMALDLLEMAALEAGSASVDLSERAVRPLLVSTLRHVDAADVPLDPIDNDLVVQVDTRRFERVIDNLVSNARNHAGGVAAIRVQTERGVVRIHVDDAGPGVPISEHAEIFKRFSRGAAGKHLPGAGLGLSLVREHLRLMHGDVQVSTSPEGGARFTVTLPLVTE